MIATAQFTHRTLALIPARGGSKGVPRKNSRTLCGRPLISYSIEAALRAGPLFHSVVVSTDDEEIAGISQACGAEVPFLRPPHLATDQARSLPVVQHAVEFMERRDRVRFDWICLLQPTTPLRLTEDIVDAIDLANDSDCGCDSVISVNRVLATHPALMKRIENDRLVSFSIPEREGTRRQDYSPAAYIRNGAIYLTRRDVIMDGHSIWGCEIRPYIMPEERSINVDSELDFKLARLLLEERLAITETAVSR